MLFARKKLTFDECSNNIFQQVERRPANSWRHVKYLSGLLLLLSGFVLSANEAPKTNYIYGGDFSQAKYAAGSRIEHHYWTFSPWSDPSGFMIERDAEADTGESFLKIIYTSAPKSQRGWQDLRASVVFTAIPDQKTTISFNARGNGFISAIVAEYSLEPRDDGRRFNEIWKGRGGTLEKVELNEAWTNYAFEYTPSGNAEIGRATLLLYFHPDKSGQVSAMIGNVQAIATQESVGKGETWQPSVFTIPKLNTPPVIDGAFSDNEWTNAVSLSAFTDYRVFSPPAEGEATAWIGYDDDGLYIAFRADDGDAPVASERERDHNTWEDDSVEILLASPDGTERAHFIVNAMNSIYDSNYKSASADAWNPEWQHAVARDARGWQAEISIPWRILNWPVKESLRMNIGHNNVIVRRGDKTSITSSWGISRLPGKNASFALVDAYPHVRLGKSDSITPGITLLYDRHHEPVLFLNLINPSGHAPNLICSYGTQNHDVIGRLVFSREYPKGTQVRIPITYPDRKERHIILRVDDLDGNTLYAHREVFREGLESNIALKKYYPVNFVEIEVDTFGITGLDILYQVLDPEGKVIEEKSTKTCGNSDLEKIRISVAEWRIDSPYVVQVKLRDAQGIILLERDYTINRPDKKEPWVGTRVGLTDQPLPPYTPIKLEGTAVKTLMKEYDYGQNILPVSIKSENNELLSAPIRLEIGLDGTKYSLAAVPRDITSRKPNRVEWRASLPAIGKLSGEWNCWVEEDGFVWHELTIETNAPVPVESLVLTVPVKKEFAKLINAMPRAMTGGDMDGQYLLKPEGWKALEPKNILAIMSEERGLEITTEDDRFWNNIKKGQAQSIFMQGDCAEVRYAFIDLPTTLEGKRVYGFGLQAFPVKPPSKPLKGLHGIGRGFELGPATTNPVIATYPSNTHVPQHPTSPAYAAYPLTDNLDTKQGTFEAWIYVGFDPQHLYPDLRYRNLFTQHFFSLEAGGHRVGLNWNSSWNGWVFSGSKNKTSNIFLYGSRPIPWQSPGWHHVALTWGDTIRIYSDGELVAERKFEGLLGDSPDFTTGEAAPVFRIGRMSSGAYSSFLVAGLRISSRPLSVSDMALKGNFPKTADTLLLEDFACYKSGNGLSSPENGAGGKLSGEATLTDFEGKTVLSLGPVPSKSRLEWWGEMGYETLVIPLGDIFCLPYIPEESKKSVKAIVDECHRHGLKVLPNFSYGVGFTSREDELYGDYWYTHPIRTWGMKGCPDGSHLFCVGCDFLTDFMLYHWDRLIDEFNLDGLYTDNTFIAGVKCLNHYHGCGWKDSQGNLNPSSNLLAGRRFLKRTYAILKQRESPLWHELHAGWSNHAMYASWADIYYGGEQYRAHSAPGWNIDLAQYRAQNFTQRYGMPSQGIACRQMVPYGYEGMWSVALLHDVDIKCKPWRPASVLYNAKIWNAKERFDTDSAEFLPYWKNATLITTDQNKRQYASLWLHRGKRALVVVSNLEWHEAEVAVKMNLGKMGLKGNAVDAFTNEPVEMQDGKAKFSLGDYHMKVLWVE